MFYAAISGVVVIATLYYFTASARKSVALPVSALIVNVVGAIFTFVGNIRKDVRTLVGAVCYVLAGKRACLCLP